MYCLYLFKNKKGVVLYLTLAVIAILLSIGLIISAILLGEIKIVKGMGDSVIAFYAADTGIEKGLDALYKTGIFEFSLIGSIGEAQYSVRGFPSRDDPNDPDCPNPPNEYFCIKSVGIYKGVRRAVDVSR